jgi:hypothetical protein
MLRLAHGVASAQCTGRGLGLAENRNEPQPTDQVGNGSFHSIRESNPIE